MENLGEVIRRQRKKLQLKVYELAGKIGIHAAYLTQIEKNHRVPSPEVLRKIEKALAIELKDTYMHLKFPVEFLSTMRRSGSTKTKQKIYDMVIKLGEDALIGVEIKIKRSGTLTHEQITKNIENALTKAMPNVAIEAYNSDLECKKRGKFLKPASEYNLAQRRLLQKDGSTDNPTAHSPK